MKTELYEKIVEQHREQVSIFNDLKTVDIDLSKNIVSDLRKILSNYIRDSYNTRQLKDLYLSYSIVLTTEAIGRLVIIQRNLEELEEAIQQVNKIEALIARL